MFKTLIVMTVIVGASVTAASQAETPPEERAPIAALAAPCATLTGAGAQLTDADLSEFLRISKWVASAPAAAALRTEANLLQWPADSVRLVSDDRLCARLDSLVVAWLAGPGAGKLIGVRGTIGNVTVTRVGTTVFHVRPGTSVPTQPVPHYPYFIVDTAAPTRVAYWGQSGG